MYDLAYLGRAHRPRAGACRPPAARAWTQAQPLTHLQTVMIGTLSWCAAVLVVATLFLGLMLLAAWVQQRHGRSTAAAAVLSRTPRPRHAVSQTHAATRSTI
jgi:hypothetical protein